MLRGLLSAKAGCGPTLTFLFISPLLNPIIVGLMWATFGWKVTLLYAVNAASVSVMASMLLDKFGFERHVIDPKEATQFCCTSGCGPAPSTTTQVAIRDNQRSTISSIKPPSGTACCAAPQPKMAGNVTSLAATIARQP
nr:permease [Aeromonas sobria]